MRICQIGCGSHARSVYQPSLIRLAKEQPLEYLACCDTDPQRGQAYQEATGFQRFYTDFQAMLAQETPDAVLITTPYPITPAIATAILPLGIPCLLEKPPAATLAETRTLAGLASQTNTLHQVAFNRRHMPLVRTLKAQLAQETIQSIEYRMHRVRRAEDFFHTTAIHGFDLVTYLAGAPLTQAQAQYQALSHPGAINASFLCTYQNNISATLTFRPLSGWVSEQAFVITDSSYYALDLPVWGARSEGGSLTRYENNQITQVWRDADYPDGLLMHETNGFYEQLRAFFACVGKGEPSPHTLDTSLDPAVLMEMMRTRDTDFQGE